MSLKPSDAYLRQQTRPPWVKIMNCRLLGTKPSSEPKPSLAYCQCQRNFNQPFVQRNEFQNVLWNVAGILSRPRCVIYLICAVYPGWLYAVKETYTRNTSFYTYLYQLMKKTMPNRYFQFSFDLGFLHTCIYNIQWSTCSLTTIWQARILLRGKYLWLSKKHPLFPTKNFMSSFLPIKHCAETLLLCDLRYDGMLVVGVLV